MKINVTLPDGTVREYEQGATAMDVALSISEGLARNVLSAKVKALHPTSSGGGGEAQVVDANRPLPGDCTVQLLTWKDDEGKATCGTAARTCWRKPWKRSIPERNSASVRPSRTASITTSTWASGDRRRRLQGHRRQDEGAGRQEGDVFARREVPKAEAIAYFKEKGDEYKLELIDGLERRRPSAFTAKATSPTCAVGRICRTLQASRRPKYERCRGLLARR
jgi:threonyl-tRNA synthetase